MANAKKTSRQNQPAPSASTAPARPLDRLLVDIRSLIESARAQTARAVNSALVGLYWHIGRRIREDVLGKDRGEYGKQILQTLSEKLTEEHGRGFGRRNVFRMVQFAEQFTDERIVSALSAQLGWSHFTEILSIDDRLKREFYAEMCRVERWSTRTLRHKIDYHLFERTAVAKKPDKLIE